MKPEPPSFKNAPLDKVTSALTIARLSRRKPIRYEAHMFRKLIAATAWALLIFIIYATLLSIEGRPELAGEGFYKAFFTIVERFGAFAALGLLFNFAYPRNVVFVCMLVFGSAIVLEFLQIFIPDRDARLVDALEKLAGGASGILFTRAFLTWRHIRL
jgi:VanZ family protein